MAEEEDIGSFLERLDAGEFRGEAAPPQPQEIPVDDIEAEVSEEEDVEAFLAKLDSGEFKSTEANEVEVAEENEAADVDAFLADLDSGQLKNAEPQLGTAPVENISEEENINSFLENLEAGKLKGVSSDEQIPIKEETGTFSEGLTSFKEDFFRGINKIKNNEASFSDLTKGFNAFKERLGKKIDNLSSSSVVESFKRGSAEEEAQELVRPVIEAAENKDFSNQEDFDNYAKILKARLDLGESEAIKNLVESESAIEVLQKMASDPRDVGILLVEQWPDLIETTVAQGAGALGGGVAGFFGGAGIGAAPGAVIGGAAAQAPVVFSNTKAAYFQGRMKQYLAENELDINGKNIKKFVESNEGQEALSDSNKYAIAITGGSTGAALVPGAGAITSITAKVAGRLGLTASREAGKVVFKEASKSAIKDLVASTTFELAGEAVGQVAAEGKINQVELALEGGAASFGALKDVSIAAAGNIADRRSTNAEDTGDVNRTQEGGSDSSGLNERSEEGINEESNQGEFGDQAAGDGEEPDLTFDRERSEEGDGLTEDGLSDSVSGLEEESQSVDTFDDDLLADVPNELEEIDGQQTNIESEAGLTENFEGDPGGRTEGSPEFTEGIDEGSEGASLESEGIEGQEAGEIQAEGGNDRAEGGEVQEGEIAQVGQEESLDSNPPTLETAAKPETENPRTPTFTLADETVKDVATRKIQDNFLGFKRAQDAIKAQNRDILDSENVYGKEVLFHGKVEKDIRAVREDYIEPLTVKVAKNRNKRADTKIAKEIKKVLPIKIGNNKLNKPFEILDIYLMAKHAPERNKYIASINENIQDAGSGISTEDALRIQEVIDSSPQGKFYQDLASDIYKLSEGRRVLLEDSGLLDSDTVDGFRQGYDFYVPLKGFFDPNLNDNPTTGKASGFNLGQEFKKAKGRKSLPSSPTANLINDMNSTIVNSRKMEIGNALFELVQANPNDKVWEVVTAPPQVQVQNPKTNEVISVDENLATAIDSDGAPKYVRAITPEGSRFIRLKDPTLRRAWNNLGAEQMGWFLQGMGSVSRYVSTINTSLNPEFVLSNFSRDLPNAIFNTVSLEDFSLAQRTEVAAKAVRDVFPSMNAIFRQETVGSKNPPKEGSLRGYYKDFIEDGAKTGFFDSKDINGIQKDLLKFAKTAQGGVVGKSRKTFGGFLDLIETTNLAVENAVRLSVYTNLRKTGTSRQKAAIVAKELTVNFNKKGEMSPTLNSLYAFFNASVQGAARSARTIKNSKTAKLAVAGVGTLGYTLGALGRANSEEDKDGVLFYDKIPDYVKRRNMVFMKENGKDYITVPMPYGLNFFYNAGVLFEGFQNSGAEGNDAVNLSKNIMASFVDSFSPIGIGDSKSPAVAALKTVTPTAVQPLTELAVNENVFGEPIKNEDFTSRRPTPDSSKGRNSTPQVMKDMVTFLNEASGGSEYIPGTVDISPEYLNHLFRFAIGGAGRFAENAASTISRAPEALEGNDTIEARNIPFFRVISKEQSPYQDIGQYYERTARLHGFLETMKKDRKNLKKVNTSRPRLARLQSVFKSTEKRLKTIRKERDRIRARKSLSDGEQRAKIKQNLDRQRNAVLRFNKEWNKAFKTKSDSVRE